MTHLFRTSIMTLLFCLAFTSQAATTWIPISSSDITVIIPFIPTESFSAPSDLQLSAQGAQQQLSWQDINHASGYQVQARNNTGEWLNIAYTHSNVIDLDARFSAYTTVRVIACNYNTCANTGAWSAVLSIASDQREIIFIHTDLLGSPVAETNGNGDLL